jgi:hypothetical protein
MHVGRAAQLLEGLPEAVGAAGVLGAGEDGFAPKILNVAEDALIIGGYYYAGQVGFLGLHHYPLNHALAAEVDQGLAGQAGGSETGGNEANDHAKRKRKPRENIKISR